MAIILLGVTKCKICGEAVDEDRPFLGFPAIRLGDIEIEYQKFNDSAAHVDCMKAAYEDWALILESFAAASTRRP